MKITTNGSVSKIGTGLMIGIVLLAQITCINVKFSEEVDYIIAIENSAGAVVRDWDGSGVTNPNKKYWGGTYESNGTTVPNGTYTVIVTGKNRTTGCMTDASRTIEVTTENSPSEGNLEEIDARWESPNIIATATDFGHPDKWYQFRFYQPGTKYNDVGPYDSVSNTTGYFTNSAWKPNEQPECQRDAYTYSFNVLGSGAADTYGEWTVWLFKAGASPDPPEEGVVSARVSTTTNVPIPEFSTIALPIATVLGLMLFMSRKKQKK
jgi:hypothetical protein